MEEELGRVGGGEAVNELDTIKLENESLKNELKTQAGVVAGLEKALTDKDNEIAALKQSLDDAGIVLEETRDNLKKTVAAYKEMVAQANPGLVAEMITGDSIEAIDASLQSAHTLVVRVKQELEAESARVRVPAGSPQRTPLDLSALSSREKIKYAIEGG
jgi:chromosome segregation ATPase